MLYWPVVDDRMSPMWRYMSVSHDFVGVTGRDSAYLPYVPSMQLKDLYDYNSSNYW